MNLKSRITPGYLLVLIYSATTSPPIALCICSMPLADERVPPPPTIRGPSPGCLTPSAAPSIRFPGSPILGANDTSGCCAWCRLEVKIAGSDARIFALVVDSPKDELMSAFKVGWEGRLGSVGEGSRST
jgi:hypothetical protein